MAYTHFKSSKKLSAHFYTHEFLRSQTAERHGIPNKPTAEVIQQLLRLAEFLEIVRGVVGVPVFINSGFRSWLLNVLIGGSKKSIHMTGRAADITAPGFGSAYELAQAIIAAGIEFDRLIFEGTWIHIEVAPEGRPPRKNVLTAEFRRFRKTRYHVGLIAPWDLQKVA